ncbi:hypothetical protein DFH29DRAFT_1004372 [Suillus ampliporus]|nr:hypothetical protein DFH29DRAFT_1004372 [Suillus ampliporus]
MKPHAWQLPGPPHVSNFQFPCNNPSGSVHRSASLSDVSDSLEQSPISPASPLDDSPQWASSQLLVPHEQYSNDYLSSNSSKSPFDCSSDEFPSSHVVSLARLQAQKSALLQRNRSLEVMLVKLEGKLEEADKCYAELLRHIQSLDTGSATSRDPFLTVANAAEKADIYPELDHYLSDHRGGRGVIRTTSTADSGALKFLTNEDRIVVSEARQ